MKLKGSLVPNVLLPFFRSPHSVGWLLEEMVCNKLYIFLSVFYLFKRSQTKSRRNSRTNAVQFWIWIGIERKKVVHSLQRLSTHFAVQKVYDWIGYAVWWGEHSKWLIWEFERIEHPLSIEFRNEIDVRSISSNSIVAIGILCGTQQSAASSEMKDVDDDRQTND